MSIQVKRVYEPRSVDDGYRVLVDRLWPRGLREEAAHVDLWLRDIAPSTELRRWYDHKPEKWPEFQKRYRTELGQHEELLNLLHDIERHRKRVTIVFGAHDPERNQAKVLADILARRPPHTHH